MKNRKLLSLLVLLMTAVSGAWADVTWPKVGEDGSESKPYTISSAADWNAFCASFSTMDYDGKFVKLTCNIPTAEEGGDVTQMAAETYQGNYFKGTFLGGDFTIKVDLGSNWEKYTCGLFRYLDGATIKNLKVDGTVHAKGWKWRGGFAGVTYGNCSFENCTSKVTIDAGDYMNNHSSGGFVGYAKGNITFTNCVFWGELLGQYATNWGGFVGQKDDDANTVTLNKCLFYPTEVTASATGSATFVRTSDADGVSIGPDGAYCTQFLGTQQGMLASTTAPTAGNGIYKSTSVNNQTCYFVATVSGIEEEYTADGSSHTLTPVLTCMGTQLTKGTDYTIADETKLTYTDAGNYSVTFNAAGSYSGSCTVSYKVISSNPSGNCGENVTWLLDLSSGVLTISGTGAMANYSSLSAIPWYSNRNFIKSVVIESGVTTIGNGAFYQCNNLASVSIPASVTSIGEESFAECGPSTGMTVTIASGSALGTIGAKAFVFSNLKSINLPDGLTTIGRLAFNSCGKLTSISIPASVTSIGIYAFAECENLASVNIPASVTSINEAAFAYCGSSAAALTVTFDAGSTLTTIGAQAFMGANLTSITIPASVTSIGNYAFEICNKLTSINIPASVTSIGKQAFMNCDNLATITLNSNPFIDEDAFSGSGALVTMNLTANPAGGAKWMTFYNKNYTFRADTNTQVFKVELNGTGLTLHKVEENFVDAGTAVVLKTTGDGMPVMGLMRSTDGDSQANSLIGVSDAGGKTSDGTMYVLNYTAANGVGFYKLASGNKVGVGKAYLTYPAGAREFFSFNEATSLSEELRVKNEEFATAPVYDLQGRRVQNPSKGLYIVNGKLVVKK